MSGLPYVTNFRQLVVYQPRQISREVYRISSSFPKQEMYSLTDQIRRSSRSIGAQIAEAWAKRFYEKHFLSKLIDANGEQLETQWIEVSADCGTITSNQMKTLLQMCEEIGRLLGGMMAKPTQFCTPDIVFHEPIAEYIV